MAVSFDHIALTAATRSSGRVAFKAITDIDLPIGGAHPQMGTHNCLSALGPDQFLELIAIDPDAVAPDHPRWFGLDDLPDDQPLCPHTVILRSDDLDTDLAHATELGFDLGTPIKLTRGELSWRFAVRADGVIPLNGAAPMLMQWDKVDLHPASTMQDQNIRLSQITLASPEIEKVEKLCALLGWHDINLHQGELRWNFTLTIDGTQVTL